jgi:hypothetical protein
MRDRGPQSDWWTQKSPGGGIQIVRKFCEVEANYFTKLTYKNNNRVVNKNLG